MSEETITAFITKYALTSGIFVFTGTISRASPGMLHGRRSEEHYTEHFHGEGRDWHRTWESALARAEKMKEAKIASLNKSIRKIERMTFANPDNASSAEKK